MNRETGKVIAVVAEKGFFFIQPTDLQSKEIFSHVNRLSNVTKVDVGDLVEFARGLDRANRPVAVDVIVFGKAEKIKPVTVEAIAATASANVIGTASATTATAEI
jgi:cold shock CspA family protein